jgi:Glycosyl hydrolases family 16
MRNVPLRVWVRQRRFRLLMLAVLILSCIIGLIATPHFLHSNAAYSKILLVSHNSIIPTSATGSALIPTSTTTLSTPTRDPSGQVMPVGNIPGWRQIFTEDFNTNVPVGSFPGTVYGNRFTVYHNGTPDTAGNRGGPSRYYPSKVVSVNNGLLNLYLHSENGTPMAAAILPDLPGNHLYGKYTIRFRSDPLSSFKTAWLLWPSTMNSQQGGEIDFPEGNLSGTMNGFVHPTNVRSDSDQKAFNTSVTYTSWHTASIEWTPNKVNFILDDKSIGTATDRIPNNPMDYVIQTESCLTDCSTARTTGNLQIDWVVVYSPA